MPPLRLIVVVLAALLVPAQAHAAPQTRIVGGVPATQAWPAQASVRHTGNGGTTNCGGTLVSARWVLTAAHCVTNDAGSPVAPGAFSLRIGSTSRESGGLLSTVDVVKRHEGFVNPPNDVLVNDVALLHITGSAPDPLRLVGSDARDAPLWAAGTTATIIGWGRTSTNGPQSAVLLEGKVPIVSDAACAAPSVWGTNFGASTMLCAGGAGVDTCPGDSGGPLMVARRAEFTLVGVVSWGHPECAKPGFPGVYARLGDPALNAWVRSTVPTVSFETSPAVPLAGQPFTLNATTSAGGAPAIVWDTDDDGTPDAAGASITHVFPAAGSYLVRVKADFPAIGDSSAVVRDVITIVEPPPPPPAPPPPPPPPPAARALTSGVGVSSKMTLLTLRTRGVRVRFTCERACTISGRLSVGPVSARRFGLGGRGRSVTIGRGTQRLLEAGTGRLTLKLTTRAKRALRNRERVTLSVFTDLRTGSVRLPGKHPVSVRR